MKKLLIIILAALVLGCVTGYVFNRYINPDSRFFLQAAALSDAWAKQVRRLAGDRPVYIIAGGSEGRSGVDPAIMMTEYDLPTINAAMAAGYGVRANVTMALKYACPGDVLVMSLATGAFLEPSAEGHCVAFAHRGWRAFSDGLIKPSAGALSDIIMLKSRAFNKYITKRICTPHDIYKYDNNTVLHESGWMDIRYSECENKRLSGIPDGASVTLPPVTEDFRTFTTELHKLCRERKLKLLIWLSPNLMHSDNRVSYALDALRLTRMGYCVLRDDTFNVSEDKTLFSDRTYHPNAAGATRNTRRLAEAIRDHDIWTEEGLQIWLQLHGWQEDGTRLPGY